MTSATFEERGLLDYISDFMYSVPKTTKEEGRKGNIPEELQTHRHGIGLPRLVSGLGVSGRLQLLVLSSGFPQPEGRCE